MTVLIDPTAAQWVVDRLDDPAVRTVADFGQHTALAIVRHGVMQAAVVYSGWVPALRMVCVTIAAETPRWATRANIKTVFSVAFDALQVTRITAIVAKDNRRSRKLAEGLGFIMDCRLRGTDRLVYGYLDSDYSRWCARAHVARLERAA